MSENKKDMTCKDCGHKTARVSACARPILDCANDSDVPHYHCIETLPNGAGCGVECGESGGCKPLNDTTPIPVAVLAEREVC